MSNANLTSGVSSRRQWLCETSLGFGSVALASMCAEQTAATPLSPRAAHHPPRAKRVIFLFMQGGQSQMDLFDPKPELAARDGQPIKKDDGPKYKGSPFRFDRHGQSGLELSETLPRLGRHADRLCVVRSMVTDTNNHSNAMVISVDSGVVSYEIFRTKKSRRVRSGSFTP